MIVIVGGGLAGLGIGWRLVQAGRSVTVLDRGRAGRGASWAAAGMLAPQVEAEPGEETLLPLLVEGRARWDGFAAELEAAAGLAVDYRGEGTLVVAVERDEAERLDFLHGYQRDMGLAVERLTGREALRLEPHLSRKVTAALYSPQDHQVDNRKLVLALKAAFLAGGGILREDCPVEAIEIQGGRVRGVRLADGPMACATLVLAAGAWSRELAGLPEELRPPVRPLKGQMLALQMDPAAPILSHVLWVPSGYLVPRHDGRLLIGGTVEEMGFDDTVTAGGVMDILWNAWEALPGIYDLPLVETWTGFRPASRDDAPILGPTAVEGLIMATGHHRNGVLLTPLTADAVSHFILHDELLPTVENFTLARFAPPTGLSKIATPPNKARTA